MEKTHRIIASRRAPKVLAGLTALLLVLTAAFGLFAPRSVSAADNQSPDASIRVINASPGSPAIDVLINGQPLVQSLAFGAPSSYAPLKAASYKLQVVPSGQPAENAIAEKDFDASSGSAYIVSIVNPLNDIKVNVDEVNLDALDTGKARVRVFHDSPDAGTIDVAVTGGDTLFSGLSSGDKSDYKDIDAGTYSFDIRGDNSTTLSTVSGLDIQAGNAYDIFAVGQISDKTFAIVPLATSVSKNCATILGLQGTDTDACVRVVHASPGSPAVDVYVNGAAATSNLGYGAATDFLIVPSGDSTKVQVTATGASVDNAVVDETVSLTGGQAYEFVATGTLDNIKLTEAQVDLTPLPQGQARVRLINASTDAGSVDLGIKNGDNLFTGTDFQGVSDYKVVDAASLTIDAIKGGESTVLTEGTVDLKEATVYEILLTGQVKDQSLKIMAISAPASVRTGAVATPSAQGTSSPVATVSSQATVSATAEALTTPQGVTPMTTVEPSPTATTAPQVVTVTVTATAQTAQSTATATRQAVEATVTPTP